MIWTPNPVADAERFAAEQDKRLERLPICDDCGNPIQDGRYYRINDTAICCNCIDAYLVEVEDYWP